MKRYLSAVVIVLLLMFMFLVYLSITTYFKRAFAKNDQETHIRLFTQNKVEEDAVSVMRPAGKSGYIKLNVSYNGIGYILYTEDFEKTYIVTMNFQGKKPKIECVDLWGTKIRLSELRLEDRKLYPQIFKEVDLIVAKATKLIPELLPPTVEFRNDAKLWKFDFNEFQSKYRNIELKSESIT